MFVLFCDLCELLLEYLHLNRIRFYGSFLFLVLNLCSFKYVLAANKHQIEVTQLKCTTFPVFCRTQIHCFPFQLFKKKVRGSFFFNILSRLKREPEDVHMIMELSFSKLEIVIVEHRMRSNILDWIWRNATRFDTTYVKSDTSLETNQSKIMFT